MGVLVFMLAILPDNSGNTMHLMRAEVPGPTKGKLVPKMRQTALILYGIYLFITLLETVILTIVGLPFYDAIVTAFATTGTGGFAVKNASIAAYANPLAEWVVSIFLFVSGINYNLYYFILIGKIRNIFKSEEFRAYVIITVASTAIITVNLLTAMGTAFPTVAEGIRAAFFQVTSIASTAGFSTFDFNLWPELSKMILVMLMFIGACAGSTAGGLKMSRLLIIFKMIKREFKHILKPNSVNSLRLDGEPMSIETGRSAVSYFAIYTVIILSSALLISFDGLDFTTNFTAAVSCFNNIGPGLSLVGPFGNYSVFSYFSKIVLSFVMLFGRLEVVPMIIMLSPTTWKKA
jgi:trk system potassium uptake protein TrkH